VSGGAYEVSRAPGPATGGEGMKERFPSGVTVWCPEAYEVWAEGRLGVGPGEVVGSVVEFCPE